MQQQGGGYGQPPGGGYGPPQGGGYQQPQGGPPQGPPGGGEPPNNVGVIIAGVWLALGVFGCLGTGLAGAMSESMGVDVSYIGVPLFISGASAMIVAPFLRTKGTGAAIGAPVGCGCLGFIFAAAALMVFYTAIWPSL
jgi:hypothetical protein